MSRAESTPAAAQRANTGAVDTFSRYAFAAALIGLAWLLRYLLAVPLGHRNVFLTYYPAVMLAVWYGGFGPGLLATALSAISSALPAHTVSELRLDHPSDWLAWVMFNGINLAIVFLSTRLIRSREHAEAALRDLQQQRELTTVQRDLVQAIIENAPLSIAILEGPEHRFVMANRAMTETMHLAADEFTGHTFRDVQPSVQQLIGTLLDRAYETGQTNENVEILATGGDGTNRYFLTTHVPLTDALLKTKGILYLAQDITEMKQAEQALSENEQRLRLALDAGQVGAWDWDIVNDRVTWSQRLYDFHQMPGGRFGGTSEAFFKLVHPDDVPRVRESVQRALRDPASKYDVEYRVLTDGRVRWVSTTGRVVFDPSGKPIRMLGATVDSTDTKLAEEERERLLASERVARSDAEHASRMKDEFLATLSHELRTPLNAILGWSQLLRTAPSDEEDVKQGLETIERNARVQSQLIEDLLDMSRIILGKVRLDVQRIDLSAIAQNTAETFKPAADAKNIALVRNIEPAVMISGDANRLQQIVYNLLSNAIKFTQPNGRVDIALRRDTAKVELCITDTGMGIDPDFLPHVFERFRQADASTTRRHTGLGLGLAIVRQLIELHGGSIIAASEGKGRGAVFTITLPLFMPTGVPQPAEDSPKSETVTATPVKIAQPSLEGVKVLVVDDEADARELIKRLLEDCRAQVQTAPSAQIALEMLERDRPHVLISDIGMPDKDGFELIRQIRQREALRGSVKVPAMALTAFARAEDRTRAIMSGYQVHLSKPIEPAELTVNVASLAGKTT